MSVSVIGRRILIPGHFAEPVVIEGAEDYGDVVTLRVRTLRGEPKDATLSAEEFEAALAHSAPAAAEWISTADQFLVVESARIRLAYAWDPHFAVSLAGIEALPHQLEAVYGRMIKQARLRFLLADDPGAGKTIMAGLLLKELRLRGAVERTLIVSPAPLTLQWQDELRTKFDEHFEVIDSHGVREQLGGSPWGRFPQCITSMDFAKMPRILPELLRERWDLVIFDEAHKVSMPDIEKPTMRYQLARALADRTERLVLLTATPHQGNPEQFRNLLRLLDEHAFRGDDAIRQLLQLPDSPWIIRRMKEDLRGFDGKPLFVDRKAYSQDFQLYPHEYALYDAVSRYVNEYLPKQTGRRKASAALARIVLQRRLASSLRAIRISLERRYDRLRKLLDELNALPPEERQKRLLAMANPEVDPEKDEDDERDDELDDLAASASTAEQLDRLAAEVAELSILVQLAVDAENRGKESKLEKFAACLDRMEFKELREKSGKLLVFTEHRATLDYLREKLTSWGYTCCEIHGGMDPVARKAAQARFAQDAQICIATDAAGEGINLQFCHLMINYDLPWNPNRLEQRMGRIHRFGQQRECSIFNFVAVEGPNGEDVVEGRILYTLLEKLKIIKGALGGDRVYDVIGLLLRVNGLSLEDMIREATYNPKRLDDYTDKIQALAPEKIAQHEENTGVALAHRQLDLARIRGQDWGSEEKRLMPEFVEDYFLAAAQRASLRVEKRANPRLLRVEHVPQALRTAGLHALRTHGAPDRAYTKLTFHKAERTKADNYDAELISPGHALYAATDEVAQRDLRAVVGGCARYYDPYATDPYRLHFFEFELEGDSLGDPSQPARTVPVYAGLVAVEEQPDGTFGLAQPDVLHDLTPATGHFPETEPWTAPPTPDELRKIGGWVRARVQFPRRQERRAERAREVEVRRDFLRRGFAASIKVQQDKMMELNARLFRGEADARLARDEAQRRLEELEMQRDHRLRALDYLATVRDGRVQHVGSALVAPAPVRAATFMQRDDEVEEFAMKFAIQAEEARGWSVEDVSKLRDGSGFDLRSVSPADPQGLRVVRRIEVKGRALNAGDVHLTPNEWRQAQRLRQTYWLYVVWGCKTGTPRLKMIVDPASVLAAEQIVEVKGWRIDGSALVGAAGEEWKG